MSAASSSPDGTQPPQAALEAPTVAPSSSDAPPSPAASDALALLVPAPSPAASDAATATASYPASDVHLARRPQYAPLDVFCGTCGSNVHVSKARCRNKTAQTWLCHKCEVKTSTLRRGFGSWPVDGFTKMTKEDQQAFFRDCKDMGARELLKKAKEVMHITEDAEAQYYQNGGNFLPLKIWETKGYDQAAIKSRSAAGDIREHPVLGTTYRLKIVEMGDRGEKRNASRQILTTKSKEKLQKTLAVGKAAAGAGGAGDDGKTGAGDAGGAGAEAEAENDAEGSENHTSDSDSSDHSSTTSSSSGKKSKKKSKKDKKARKDKRSKKDKKARKDEKSKKKQKAKRDADKKAEKERKEKEKAAKKEQAEQERAEKRAHDQKKRHADNVLSKTASVVSCLNKTLECPESIMLSDDLRKTGEDALAELKHIQLRCRCAIADPKKHDDLISMKDLMVKLNHAKKIDSLMNCIYKAAEGAN